MKPADILGIKKREYLKDKINELATNSKNKNFRDLYRGINECKRGYQPRNNFVKDENGDLLAGLVAQIGERRDVYRFLVGKPEGKRLLGRLRHRWTDNISMDIGEVGWDELVWLRIGTGGVLL
jgi:hypothetical protein